MMMSEDNTKTKGMIMGDKRKTRDIRKALVI
jgi:hypothetical protein